MVAEPEEEGRREREGDIKRAEVEVGKKDTEVRFCLRDDRSVLSEDGRGKGQ